MKDIFKEIKKEVEKAEDKFPEYHSMHEGYAIILEEVDELWDEVRKSNTDYKKAFEESKHIACTAIRFMKMCQERDVEL